MRCRWRIIGLGVAATTVGLAPIARAQTTHNVELDGIRFIPRHLTIEVGDTVHWVWVSGFHNVESGVIDGNGNGMHDGNFRSGNPSLTVATTFDVTFNQNFLDAHSMPDSFYAYFCVVHASVNMAGTISVMLPGDLNGDGAVNVGDQSVFTACMTGPDDTTLPPGCTSAQNNAADLDDDGDTDLRDYAVFLRAAAQ